MIEILHLNDATAVGYPKRLIEMLMEFEQSE